MSEDDDWFEKGLEDESEESRTAEEEDGEAEASERTNGEGEPAEDTGAETPSGAEDPFSSEASGDGTDPFASGGAESESPFGETGNEDPFSGDAFGGGGSGGGGGGRGGGSGSAADEGEELFEDGFADAMGAVGSGGSESDFESEDFESDIPRLDVGIEGLDNMIQGGVPERHLIVTIGGAGTGKTTFGLEFIHHGLQQDDPEKGVFITLEQTYDDIMNTANERGWEFDRHEEEGNLAIIDLDPVEMANSLDNIRGELPELIEDFDADRFVLDSVSLLEMMYEDVAKRRTEVFDFTQSLKDAGVTTVLTSEANENNPYASRHGIIEYLTDAVFLLRYVRSETQETRLAVEIQKIRNANHSRETKPYEITMDGISVYEQANIF